MSQLEDAGLSWKAYMQGMPYAGYRGLCYPARCGGVPDFDTLYNSKHNIGSGDNVLASVAANSPADIWAVGQIAPDAHPNLTNTLIQHYDGNVWSVVTSPNKGSKANALLRVTASSGMAWAAGYFIDDSHQPHSLIEAWNGSAWTIVEHPKPGLEDWLFGISATSPLDIWAVGTQKDSNGLFQTLIEHFDGAFWSVVPSPAPARAAISFTECMLCRPAALGRQDKRLAKVVLTRR